MEDTNDQHCDLLKAVKFICSSFGKNGISGHLEKCVLLQTYDILSNVYNLTQINCF
jgi:hypothetical protein